MNLNINGLSVISVFVSIFFLLSAGPLIAAEGTGSDTSYEAVTVADPGISVEELDLRLRPLRRNELKAEAEAWLDLLAGQVSEVSTAEIAVKYKLREISMAGELEATLDKVDQSKAALAQSPDDASLQQAATILRVARVYGRDVVRGK